MTNDTTDTTAFAAVPDLPDRVHLEIVQNQIQATQIELAKHERLLRALPPKDDRRPQLRTVVENTREILAGYRTQEAELLARLSPPPGGEGGAEILSVA